MENKRKSISKKKRFDVFKRDSFTCQYCGKKAPDVILEVDHIKPVVNGGNNGMLNLITSCFDCNRGKGKRELSENHTLAKELNQLELLNERKQQIEMMFKWQNELLNLDDKIVDKVNDYWNKLTETSINENGLKTLKKIIAKYPIDEILEGMRESYKSYSEPETAFNNLSKVISVRRLQKDKPYMKDIFYIRSIMKYNWNYYDKSKSLNMLVTLYEDYNYTIEELKKFVRNCSNWSQFIYDYDGVVDE